LKQEEKMLTTDQKSFYEKEGYLKVENAVTPEEVHALQEVTQSFIDAARGITGSNDVYDVDAGHTAETPRLTRIKLPHKQHPLYDTILKKSGVTEVITDLLGPDTVLLTAKLNTKAPGGGAAVEWHQDWAFYPHTNDNLLAVGLFLKDVTEENGPLMVQPRTHTGPLLSHHANGVFAGAIDPDDPLFDPASCVTLTGKAGDMTVHHARTLHGSAPNRSQDMRQILFFECAAADAWPLLGSSSYFHALGQRLFWDDLQDRMITGVPCLTPRLEPVPVTMPVPPAPDTSSIFKIQTSGQVKSAFEGSH
jgi:ectoine hydroxylase-related dioxygenase (phytanoyl-CoA dioxygenase family)